MKTFRDLDFKNKTVVVRTGFDVPVTDGQVDDDSRLVAGLPTLEELWQLGPKLVVVLNHIGRPGGRPVADLSNAPICRYLGDKMGMKVGLLESLEDLDAKAKALSETSEKKMVVLENIRFWAGEKAGSEDLGRQIGQLFDVYVNDCLSVSHRAHASLVQVSKFTQEKCAGLLLEEEVRNLTQVRDRAQKPAVAVIGGAKIETKLPVIENLSQNYQKVLVGGLVANEALDQNLQLPANVILPEDFAPAGQESQRLDIGPKTLRHFKEELAQAQTIVWNGPLGKFEEGAAAQGTREVIEAIKSNQGAFKVIGGGETLEAVKQLSSFEGFDYVSMSGGAMLDFLAGKQLPGLEALE